MTERTNATMLVVYEKARRPDAEADWLRWHQHEHLADLLATAATAVTFGEVTPKPEAGMPGIGFSHVTLVRYGSEGRVEFAESMSDLRRRGRLHDAHTVVDAHVFTAHGPWAAPSVPDDEVRGHILTYVMANDERDEADWDRWYDDVHLPDMMASGAFSAASRWRRHPRREVGPNHITLYDISHEPIEQAVRLSAAALPALIGAGRKHRAHTGAMTLLLKTI